MKNRVLRIVSQIMDVPMEQLNENSSPEDVKKWDSLRHMNLILALEEEFGTAFSDQEIGELISVKIIVETLKKNLSQN